MLSPRSMRLWHQIRKELGMTFDLQYIDDLDYHFNDDAELVAELANRKKNDKDGERILSHIPVESRRSHMRRSRNPSNVVSMDITRAVLVQENEDEAMDQRRHYRRGERESM